MLKYKLFVMKNSSLPSELVPSHTVDYWADCHQQSLPLRYLQCQPPPVQELSNGEHSCAERSAQ